MAGIDEFSLGYLGPLGEQAVEEWERGMMIGASSEVKRFDRQIGLSPEVSPFAFRQTRSPWYSHARQWHSVGAPLRPCAEDIRLMVDACPAGKANILLLGVTPEIAEFSWPAGTHITAVDLHLSMIRHVWPGNRATRKAICADWLSLPFASCHFDIVIGDGCLTLLSFPSQYGQLSDSVRRVLMPEGVWVMRQFCRPEQAESLEEVSESLWSGGIGSIHVLKWRIAMAVHGDRYDYGVLLDDIWCAYRSIVPDPSRLTSRFGWAPNAVATVENYRGSHARYTFPSLAEVALAMPEFDVRLVGHGDYELAECCPILSLSPVTES